MTLWYLVWSLLGVMEIFILRYQLIHINFIRISEILLFWLQNHNPMQSSSSSMIPLYINRRPPQNNIIKIWPHSLFVFFYFFFCWTPATASAPSASIFQIRTLILIGNPQGPRGMVVPQVQEVPVRIWN